MESAAEHGVEKVEVAMIALIAREQLEVAVCLKLAYVNLCLGNPQDAMLYAKTVIEMPQIRNSIKIR